MKFLSKRFRKEPIWRQKSKKKGNSYSLLLREKKRIIRSESSLGVRRTVFFVWEKYKNSLFGVLGGIFTFGILTVFFFFTNLFIIEDIALTRKDFRVNTDGIGTLLDKSLRGKNIFLLSNRNIEGLIQQHFPEVETVEVRKDFPHLVEVIVSTFPIEIRWEFIPSAPEEPVILPGLEEYRETESRSNIFVFLNSLGRISLTEPGDEEKAFPVSEEVKTLPEEILFGEEILTPEKLNALLRGKELLESSTPFRIVSAQFFRDAQEIHFLAENGPAFWTDFFSPFEDQIAKIPLALEETDIFSKPVEYLDLRIAGKLIYKEADG